MVSLRYNTGLSIISTRSKCFTCNTELKWYELIPLFSFLFLGGKCNRCKSKISWQYPLVELLAGVIFVGIAIRQFHYFPLYSMFSHGLLYSVLFFIYYALVFSLLMVIALYDIKHRIIPNSFVYAFIILSVAKLGLFFIFKNFQINSLDLFDLLSPLALFGPFAFLWLVSAGRWIGFGDAKLVFGIGALLGFVSGVSSVILAFWVGAFFSIYLIIRSKLSRASGEKLSFHSEIPFAPFLILAAGIVFFSRIDVLGIGTLLASS